MDSKDDTTVQAEHKRGQHLGPEERGAAKALNRFRLQKNHYRSRRPGPSVPFSLLGLL